MWLIFTEFGCISQTRRENIFTYKLFSFVQFCGKAVRRHERCIIVVSIAKQ